MYHALKELIERLVDQFADPYAFLREIVQNSLDAGSPEVDFRIEYQQGNSLLTCQDTGEGMDEQLIDTRLTRIFSSSKEDDLTKIGQFGIGFLSLFALKPDHVVVETGRNGQAWRVHFSSDHSFSKTRLSEPVDGTRIRWIKQQPEAQHQRFQRACQQALKLWCRHAQAQIRVQGKLVNEPFNWDDPEAIHGQRSGTEVTLRPGRGWLGLYNQGLTLSEGEEKLWPGLDVKISSRYLEHTLTRDRVVRNDNFAKAQQVVDDLLRERLLPRLLETRDYASLAPLVKHLSTEQRRLPLVGSFSIQQLERAKVLYYSAQRDGLVSRLDTEVLIWDGRGGLTRLLEEVNPRLLLTEVHQAYFLPELVKPEPRQRSWLKRLVEALASQGELYQAAWLCEFPAAQRLRPWLACQHPQEPVGLAFDPLPDQAKQLLLNIYHPAWGRFWDLDPEWGGAALCQPLWNCFPQLDKEQLLRQFNSF
ncbi:ATP-binding protein [bacterium]|nr:ATP-binding protein [bacterium]